MAIDLDDDLDDLEKTDTYHMLGKIPDEFREISADTLARIVAKYGPFIDTYPSWHPLVMNQLYQGCPQIEPCEEVGYRGLDHYVKLRNAFITCPYSEDAANEVIESVNELPQACGPYWSLHAERIDCRLYDVSAIPVLVYCEWSPSQLVNDKKISLRCAAGLLLESEMKAWREASLGESWETMEIYFLGSPNDGKSSAFLSETATAALKKMWNAVIGADVFGPVKR